MRPWIGAIGQQATIWANIDSDLCHYMSSLGHNKSVYLYAQTDHFQKQPSGPLGRNHP